VLTSIFFSFTKKEFREGNGRNVNVWLQSRSLPARGRVGLEVRRCFCIIDAGNALFLRRGAQAVARSAVPCASQVLDYGAEAAACGAARCASHALDRGVQAGA
jgi:hypothetical protein